MRSYQHQCIVSHQNSAVKRARVRVVLGWVTSLKVLVLHPSFRVLRVPFRSATCHPNGFGLSYRHRSRAIVNLNTRLQDNGRQNRACEILPRFLPQRKSNRLRMFGGNDKRFGRLSRKLCVETLGGGRSNCDGGDGSLKESMRS